MKNMKNMNKCYSPNKKSVSDEEIEKLSRDYVLEHNGAKVGAEQHTTFRIGFIEGFKQALDLINTTEDLDDGELEPKDEQFYCQENSNCAFNPNKDWRCTQENGVCEWKTTTSPTKKE